MSLKRNIDLIHELLNSRDPVRYQKKELNIIFRMGYLIGFLAKLAEEDSYVKSKILQAIKKAKENPRR